MSRGQLARTPTNFPQMKHRAMSRIMRRMNRKISDSWLRDLIHVTSVNTEATEPHERELER